MKFAYSSAPSEGNGFKTVDPSSKKSKSTLEKNIFASGSILNVHLLGNAFLNIRLLKHQSKKSTSRQTAITWFESTKDSSKIHCGCNLVSTNRVVEVRKQPGRAITFCLQFNKNDLVCSDHFCQFGSRNGSNHRQCLARWLSILLLSGTLTRI